MKKKNLTTLSEFIDKKVGKKGTKKETNLKLATKHSNLESLFNKLDKKED